LLAGRSVSGRYEYQGRRRDGTLIWIECLASVVSWEGGPAILATFLDISERKRAEETLREQESQLRQAQKMEAVGRLAGGVAHDFNNLLMVIRGRSEVLLRRLAPEVPWREDIALIDKTAERAAGLTRQLLAFGRKQVLQPKVIDLNAIVAGMEPILRRLIGEHIELVRVPGPALGCVRADPGQLEQVVMNLAVNARDAMPRGGRLSLETGIAELDEGFVRRNPGARPGTHVTLAVTDTGAGMNEYTKAHLFEPFFTTRGPGKGTGLGLATVYGIIRQSGGHIVVESELGHGATFRIYLPRVEAAPEAAEPPPAAPRPCEGRETVLLVEDEDRVRSWVHEVLGMHGYTVLEAPDGDEALRVVERHPGPIDLLLTDVVMPHMSGRELADRLVLARPGLKVLYMSGYTDDAIVHHGVLGAGTALIQKPFGVDALARQVRDVLEAAPAPTA
jgi:signal transduction histidine kinase/CheY-like chemotaxis protein